MKIDMQITLIELLGFFGIIVSITTGVWWIISNRFSKLEGRVGRLEDRMTVLDDKFAKLEEKIDQILHYLAPKNKKLKKLKHLRHKY